MNERKAPTKEAPTKEAPTKEAVAEPFVLPTNDRAISPYRQNQQPDHPLSRHRLVNIEQRARGAWGAASVLVALAAIIAIPFALNESRFTAVLASMLAIGFAWLSVITLRMYVAERAANVSVYDGFLRCTTGGKSQDIPWESVRSVRVEYSVMKNGGLVPSAALALTRSDGVVVALPRAIEDPEGLAREVLARTEKSLSKAVRMMLARNVEVAFGGDVYLSQRGICVGGKTWEWKHSPNLRAAGPFLHFGATLDPMPPSVVLANEVQNLHVIMALIADPQWATESNAISMLGDEALDPLKSAP